MQCNLLDAQNKLPEFDQFWQNKELDIFRNGVPASLSGRVSKKYGGFGQRGGLIPKAFMHRDFHCRNLLLCSKKSSVLLI